MNLPGLRTSLAAVGLVLLAATGTHAQTPEEDALASATAQALEPGVRAALRGGEPVSFEYQSAWGQAVKKQLEESLGMTLTDEHRRGASRILLGAPAVDSDTAIVEVWFGRCEADTGEGSEILRVRMYSFAFRRDGNDWVQLRSARLGTTVGSCDGDWRPPGAVQT